MAAGQGGERYPGEYYCETSGSMKTYEGPGPLQASLKDRAASRHLYLCAETLGKPPGKLLSRSMWVVSQGGEQM